MMRQILGQDRAIEILQAALRGGRIGHAWIFHGPPGVGKRTTAEAFAAALLDPGAQPDLSGFIEADPDGRTAQQVASGDHPDLHLVNKELAAYSRKDDVRKRKQITIPVEVVREFLIEPVYRRSHAPPGARSGKVFILDEAELMAREGQNALLKALEEPPPGAVIILVTSRLDMLLPTILSRCQRVAFTPLNEQAMQEWLGRRLGAEGLDPHHSVWLLRYAQGAPGLAEIALSGDLYSWYREIEPQLREIQRGEYPAQLGALMAKLVDSYAAAWAKEDEKRSKDAANKAAARYLFILLAEEWRRFLGEELRAGRSGERPMYAIDMIRNSEQRLATNVNLGLLLDELVIQWLDGSPVPEAWFAT